MELNGGLFLGMRILILILSILFTAHSSIIRITNDFLIEVAKGNVAKHSLIHKFGFNNVGTTIEPITLSGFYRTPKGPTSLEFVSDSNEDSIGNLGAQEVTIIGLDSNWRVVTQTLVTNGTNAVALDTNLTRLFRWYVSSSGTYANQDSGSHIGKLTIRESGGGNTWSEIEKTPFQIGQSEIGVYSVPTGYTAYLLSKSVSVDGVKSVDVFFFQRPLINDTTAPYTGTMRLIEREVGVSGSIDFTLESPKGPFIGPCDIGFMGVVGTGTAEVSAEFELLLIED